MMEFKDVRTPEWLLRQVEERRRRLKSVQIENLKADAARLRAVEAWKSDLMKRLAAMTDEIKEVKEAFRFPPKNTDEFPGGNREVTGKAIKGIFRAIPESSWDHYFESKRAKKSGLAAARVGRRGKFWLYKLGDVAGWIITMGLLTHADVIGALKAESAKPNARLTNTWDGLGTPSRRIHKIK